MCYRSRLIKNPIKEPTGFDKVRVRTSCCRCPDCRRVRSNDWLVRSYFEFLGNNRQAFFFSLDFDDEHLPKWNDIPCFDSSIMSKWLKRFRKLVGKFRYFYSTDYGGLLRRPHYHIIVLPEEKFSLSQMADFVCRTWQQGHYTNIESMDSVNNDRLKAIKYVSGYTTKDLSFDVDVNYRGMPLSKRPRVQASRGYGIRALEEGIITSVDILKGNTVDLPIGKGGSVIKFCIPRYYEMKYCYDYSIVDGKSVLTKNAFGVQVCKERYNGQYVYYIKQLFSSRYLDLLKFGNNSIPYKSWYDTLSACTIDFSDFKEFVYYRPFVTNMNRGYVRDNLRNESLFRPSWSFYESVCQIYDKYCKSVDEYSDKVETEKLLNSARLRALKRIQQRPYLRLYLARRHFDFRKLQLTHNYV